MTKDNVWYLQCLGEMRAEQNGRAVHRFHTQKTAALLALLALRGGQNRESVCALLWPDKAPEAARNSLSACLSALRRDLGPDIIEADRQRVALATGIVETDVAEFDRALKNANYARAVELYRGPLLPNFHEDPFPALAGEYEEKARGAFCHRIEELEETADFDALRSIARRAALLFGDDQRWFLALMRAHRMANDLDAALRTYEALGRYARKNGDVASETARALAKSLRREREQQLSRVATSPISTPEPEFAPEEESKGAAQILKSNLPPAWTRFFGREAERTLLSDWLSQGNHSALLITLSGAGGSGKTRLAIETLRATSDEESVGNIFFVPLASLSDSELLHGTIRDAIGLMVTPNITPLEQLKRTLNGQNALFLLDNFEQLMPEGAEKLQVLRAALPDAAFLVTSRVLLNLPGEREFPVAPLPTPLPNSSPIDVGSSPSVALFCDRAGLTVDKSNAEAMSALCRRLDGIPLALELAAARAKVLSPAQILERLSSHPNFLQSREFGLPARHQTLRATIEWSTQLLSPELRQFFCRLSVFRGGWTFDAAETVCDNYDALDALTVLRESSLVRVDARGSGSRFRMLETLREFGQEQLGEEKAVVERAFFDYFLQLAQQAASAMQGPEQTTWLGRLDAEQDNLRAALDWAQAHDASRGLQLATALIDFWETRLSLDEGRHWIETFLRATEPKIPAKAEENRSRALSGAGRLASHTIELETSRNLVEQGLEAARQSGHVRDFVYAVTAFVRFAMTTGDGEGDLARARVLSDEAVAMSRKANDKAPLLEALVALNHARVSNYDLEAVRATHVEAIALARELGDEGRLADSISSLAHVAYLEKQWDESNALLDESTEIGRRLDTTWELLAAIWTRSNVAREQGNLSVALAAINEEWEICRDKPALSWARAMILPTIAYICVRMGDVASAAMLFGTEAVVKETTGFKMAPVLRIDYERYREEAHQMLGETAFKVAWQRGRGMSTEVAVDIALRSLHSLDSDNSAIATRSRALSGAGRLAWYANDFTSAESLLSQGLQTAQQTNDASTSVYALHSSARLAAVAGNIEQARELGLESVRISRESQNKALLLASLVDLGPTYILTAAYTELIEVCDEAIGLARELRDEHALALALYMHAIGDFYEGRYDVAQPLLIESEALCRRLGARWDLMVCLGVVGSVWRELNEFDKAQAAFDECLMLAREPLLESIVVNNILLATAYLFVRRGDYNEAVCLIAGCDALAEKIGGVLPDYLLDEREGFLEISRSHLSEDDFKREWQKGRGFTTGQTIDFALRLDREGASNVDLALMATRARALSGAGRLAWYDSQMNQANSLLEQGLNAAKQSGDASALIYASRTLARVAAIDGDIERARQLGAESVRLSREASDKALLLESLIDLSFAHFNLPDLPAAQLACEEALGLAKEMGDEHAIALSLATLASISDREEKFEEAISYAAQAEVLCRRLGAHWESMVCAACKADSYSHLGDVVASQNAFTEALNIAREHFLNSWNVVTVFMSVCSSFLRRGDAVGAARVRGVSDALADSIDYKLMPTLVPEYEQTLVQLREALGEESFNREYKRGRGMSSEEAIDFAINRPIDAKDLESGSDNSELIATRSRALSGAGRLAWHDSDFNTSRQLVMQGLDTARQSGDAASFVVAIAAFVRFATTTGDVEGDIAQSLNLAREAVEISRASGDKSLLLESLISLCYAAVTVGNFLGMRAVHREAIAISRELGDENRLVQTLVSFAMQTYCEENYSETRDYLNESIEISRRLNSPFTLFSGLFGNANVARETSDLESAERYINEALELCRNNQAFRWNVSNGLYGASYLRAARGDLLSAAQIMGAAYALGEQVGYKLVPILRLDFERYHSLILQKIGEAAFQKAWDLGGQMSLDAALDFAIGDAPKSSQDELLAARSRALSGAGRLAWHNSDLEATRQLVQRGLDTAQQSGDLQSFVEAVAAFVRFAMVTGDVEGYMAQSRILSEEATQRCREAGNEALLLESLLALGYAHCIVGHLSESLEVNHEAAELGRKLGDAGNLARVLTNLSSTNYHLGRYASARAIVDETTSICRELNSPWDLIASLWVSSSIAREQGDLELAFSDIAEVLEICRVNPAFRWGVANVLLTMSYLRVARGEEYAAVQMMGASQKLWEETGYHLVPILRVDYNRFKTMAFEKLGKKTFEDAWEKGRAMTHDAAIDFALENEVV